MSSPTSGSAVAGWPTGTGREVSGRDRYSVLVEVRLREGIADPEGATIERALPALGFDGVSGVRTGKAFRFEVEADDEPAARARAAEVADRLLANPVIEDSAVSVVAAVGSGG
jgi:phosphoribosylformylglycinamidine synthase subunit PurS